jgi:anaerobic selenocysteine-containing dehydrogenase
VVHGRQALLLPCLGRTEIDQQAGGAQGVTVEDSMSMVHLSAGINAPASPMLLSEPAIVARLAAATLPASKTPWLWLVEDYSRIRDKIEAVFDDFAGFNEKIRKPGGFRLRNTASERVWVTASNKAQFSAHPVPRDTAVHRARKQTDAVVLTLATVRSHDQYNTTIYGMDDRYRGVYGHRRVVFINRDDLKEIGMKAGDWVDISSVYFGDAGSDERRTADKFLLVEYDIPRGCIASYYPETNALVPLQSFAIGARTPTSKSIPVVLTLRPKDGSVANARDVAEPAVA